MTIYKALLWASVFQKCSRRDQPWEKRQEMKWEKDEESLPESMVDPTRGEFYSTERTYACKGSGLSHISWDARIKEIKPIRGSKRTKLSDRQGQGMRSQRYFRGRPNWGLRAKSTAQHCQFGYLSCLSGYWTSFLSLAPKCQNIKQSLSWPMKFPIASSHHVPVQEQNKRSSGVRDVALRVMTAIIVDKNYSAHVS